MFYPSPHPVPPHNQPFSVLIIYSNQYHGEKNSTAIKYDAASRQARANGNGNGTIQTIHEIAANIGATAQVMSREDIGGTS